jgi:transcriptional regulator with XRE-family HTH domain
MARGLYQNLTAELAGITKGMLSSFETGRRTPIVYTLTKLLIALDCSAEEFGRYVGPWDICRAQHRSRNPSAFRAQPAAPALPADPADPIRAGLETLSVGLATGRPPWDGLVRKLRLGPRQEAAAGERPLP